MIAYYVSHPLKGLWKTYGINRQEGHEHTRIATFKDLESAKLFAKELSFPFEPKDKKEE